MAKIGLACCAALAAALLAHDAQAQNCLGRPDFDACMAAPLAAAQQRNALAQQQLFQGYLQQFGPWLKEQYTHYQGPMSFMQFAYWNMMTANGTNIQGAIDNQRRVFEGNQRAANTLRQGGEDYIAGIRDNSRRNDAAVEQFDRGAIRGAVPQIDPQTGQSVDLPYAQPYNQPFRSGGDVYVQNQSGYYKWNGSAWQPMLPGR